MFLTLAHGGDRLAARVHERLRERHGADRARLLSADDLALNVRWTFRQEGSRARTEMRFADGATVASTDLAGVFNRLRFAVAPRFEAAGEIDREYAVTETHAFLVSWLASLTCPVVNRVEARALGGDVRGTIDWFVLAGRVNLPTRGWLAVTDSRRRAKPQYEAHVPQAGAGLAAGAALTPTSRAVLGRSPAHFLEPLGDERRRVLVLGNRAHGGDLTEALKSGCVRLARAGGCSLAEFVFARGADDCRWKLCAANSFPPDLGAEEVEGLVDLLEAGGES